MYMLFFVNCELYANYIWTIVADYIIFVTFKLVLYSKYSCLIHLQSSSIDWKRLRFSKMTCMLQNSLMSPGSGSRSSASNSGSTSSASTEGHSESAGRPRAGSDSGSSRGPVSKVIDLFRHRSHSAVSAEEKRKAVSTLTVVKSSSIYRSLPGKEWTSYCLKNYKTRL